MKKYKVKEKEFVDKLVDIAKKTGSYRKVTQYYREHNGADVFGSICLEAKIHSIKRINRALLRFEED